MTEDRPAEQNRSRAVTSGGIVMILLTVLGLLASPVLLFGTLFLFDAPGAEDSVPTNALALILVLFPFICIAAFIAAFRALRRSSARALTWSAGLLGLWGVALGIAVAVIEVQCDGRFAC